MQAVEEARDCLQAEKEEDERSVKYLCFRDLQAAVKALKPDETAALGERLFLSADVHSQNASVGLKCFPLFYLAGCSSSLVHIISGSHHHQLN
jgi:hypothetical protein